MNYGQYFFLENFTLIAMVVGMYLALGAKSPVEGHTRIKVGTAMTLILLASVSEFLLDYFLQIGRTGVLFAICVVTYHSLRPVIMGLVVTMAYKNRLWVWLPAAANCCIYIYGVLAQDLYKMDPKGHLVHTALGESSTIFCWVYWLIILVICSMRFTERRGHNRFAAFFCIGWVMTADVLQSMEVKAGILNHTLAVGFAFYFLIVHMALTRKVEEEKDLALKAQHMSLMLSQIQPHFLYNTLNTIAALCRVNPRLAEDTTIKFSSYLRENTHLMGKNDLQPFGEELSHTDVYLDIEKVRFGDRVKVVYDIQADDFKLPTLTLQPIVENAVKHGICKRPEGGTVKISTRKVGKDYIIVIEDDGVGFDPDMYVDESRLIPNMDDRERGLHLGLRNVQERLRSLADADMEVESLVGVGTRVTITIRAEKERKTEKRERREILSIGR